MKLSSIITGLYLLTCISLYSGVTDDSFIRAVREGKTEIVRLALAAGFDPNRKYALQLTEDDEQYTGYQISSGLFEYLTSVPLTPLNEAATNNHTPIIQLLLQAGANPNVYCYRRLNPEGPEYIAGISSSPLGFAVDHNNEVAELLHHNANPNSDRPRALGIAAYHGSFNIVQQLLTAGANPFGLTYFEQKYALEIVSQRNHTLLIPVLEHAEDVNLRLLKARIRRDWLGAVKALQEGAYANGFPRERAYCIRFPIDDSLYCFGYSLSVVVQSEVTRKRKNVKKYKEHTHMIRLLLDWGAKVDQTEYDIDNMTPLHLAVAGDLRQTVALLLSRGAHSNAIESKCGRTPLHLTVALMSLPMTTMLLNAGAKRMIKDTQQNETPYDSAIRKQNDPYTPSVHRALYGQIAKVLSTAEC